MSNHLPALESEQARPEILAPAGNRASFLAALAARADAIYCGLKNFSARMEADNFSLSEFTELAHLARGQESRTYLTLNTMLRSKELGAAGRLLERTINLCQPDALIIQDLGLVSLVRQTGFTGEIHLSTLANLSLSKGLSPAKSLGITRVVLPRELNIEEIKALAKACPQDLGLEVFVHGALCYAVSGRCYWSSWLGGKSGLRGRCVQPCRRKYTQQGKKERFFSCLDLSLDVLSKTLLKIPQIKTWKIEGRKKGPHYVFYTVKAYQLLRDHPSDPKAKKQALEYLEYNLGRKGSHYFFLPQKPHLPLSQGQESASGLFVGLTGRDKVAFFRTRQDLLAGDLLRIGYQDQPGHFIYKVSHYLSKGKKINLPRSKENIPPKTPVFLIDRREPELWQMIQKLEARPQKAVPDQIPQGQFTFTLSKTHLPGKTRFLNIFKSPRTMRPQGKKEFGAWISPSLTPLSLSKKQLLHFWSWLPPVLWPGEERRWQELLSRIIKAGGKKFVLNSPWQIGLFPAKDSTAGQKLEFWAGPFCNLANTLALATLKSMGFTGAIISPELPYQDFISLPQTSPLPLGIVISGPWPLCIARILDPRLRLNTPLKSPKGETSYVEKSGQNYYHYPDWELKLKTDPGELRKAGYRLLISLEGQPGPGRERQKTSKGKEFVNLL